MNAMKHKNLTLGLTIVEILVAISIFLILLVALTGVMMRSLALNRSAQGQVNSTTRTQQVMESIRGAWAVVDSSGSRTNYDRACAPVDLPAGYTARFMNLDSRANLLTAGDTGQDVAVNPAGGTVNCAAQPLKTLSTGVAPRMRRLVVSSGTGSESATLSLDVIRP